MMVIYLSRRQLQIIENSKEREEDQMAPVSERDRSIVHMWIRMANRYRITGDDLMANLVLTHLIEMLERNELSIPGPVSGEAILC